MMRILQIGPPLDSIGGIAAVAGAIQHMSFGRGSEVHYFANTASPRFHEHSIRRVLRHLDQSLRLRRVIAQYRPHIVHFHTCSGFSFWRTLADMVMVAQTGRAATALHLHGGGFRTFYERASVIGRRLIRATLHRASAVIVLTPGWSEFVSSIAPQVRGEVIANGVPIPPQAGHWQPQSALTLGCLAKLDREKGILDLLDAFERLVGQDACSLRIAGPAGDLEGLKERIESHNARHPTRPVELLGPLGPEARDALLSTTDLFILPSHAEGLPLVVLEAMARAKPVVATAVGGLPDLIRHGENGWLVPPREPQRLAMGLQTMIRDADLRRRLGQAGRQTVIEQYSLERQRCHLEALYRRLARGATELDTMPARTVSSASTLDAIST